MPAATNKADLIAVCEKEFAKLDALIAPLTAKQAISPDSDNTSIKDVVAHRAHWIELFMGWYQDGMAGKAVCFPAPGYKWSELKRYNADLRQQQADMTWPDAIKALHRANKTLMTFLRAHSDGELYDGPMKGANNNWTPGRWAEAAGPSHYRSASKYIRQRLKSG